MPPVVTLRHRWSRLSAVALAGRVGWPLSASGGREDLSLTAFQAVRWSRLPPHPDYAVSWATLLVVLLAVAWGERAVRQ